MGTQQLLLIVLGVIIVGIAVVVGINIFGSNAEQANKDALTQDCLRIASAAQGYYRKPVMLGGGDNTFDDIEISDCGMTATADEFTSDNVNGEYVITGSGQDFTVTGTNPNDDAKTVAVTVDMTQTTDDERVTVEYAGW